MNKFFILLSILISIADDMAVLHNDLPDICRSGHGIWRSHCPLICSDIVELHLLDRVMRQFGLEQVISDVCDTQPALHEIDKRTGDKNYIIRQDRK